MWKILYFPFTFFLFLVIPFVVIIDAVFREANIIFISPEAFEARRTSPESGEVNVEMNHIENNQPTSSQPLQEEPQPQTEHFFFAYFRRRIHRPILRIIAHNCIEILYLLSLTFTLLDPLDDVQKKQYHFYDYLTIIFVASYLMESFIDLLRNKGHSLSSFTFFQLYNITSSFLLAVGGLAMMISFREMKNDNRAEETGNNAVNVGATILAFGATMSLLKPLRWFLLNRTLGPVVVCIIKVLKDVFHIFLIFFVVFGAFSISSYFMFKPFYLHDSENSKFKLHQDDLVSLKGVFGAMFWRILDAGQPHYAAILLNYNITKNGSVTHDCITRNMGTNKEDEYDINCLSEQFSHVMAMAFWAVYQSITCILLINILIAMSE